MALRRRFHSRRPRRFLPGCRLVEDGRARVYVLEEMIKLYHKAGGEAERIFILNVLPELVRDLAQSVDGVRIDRLTVMDSGNSAAGLASATSRFPAAIIKLTEQIEAATGINILSRLAHVDATEAEGDGAGAG